MCQNMPCQPGSVVHAYNPSTLKWQQEKGMMGQDIYRDASPTYLSHVAPKLTFGYFQTFKIKWNFKVSMLVISSQKFVRFFFSKLWLWNYPGIPYTNSKVFVFWFVYFGFGFRRQGFSVYPWLSWNSLCCLFSFLERRFLCVTKPWLSRLAL